MLVMVSPNTRRLYQGRVHIPCCSSAGKLYLSTRTQGRQPGRCNQPTRRRETPTHGTAQPTEKGDGLSHDPRPGQGAVGAIQTDCLGEAIETPETHRCLKDSTTDSAAWSARWSRGSRRTMGESTIHDAARLACSCRAKSSSKSMAGTVVWRPPYAALPEPSQSRLVGESGQFLITDTRGGRKVLIRQRDE